MIFIFDTARKTVAFSGDSKKLTIGETMALSDMLDDLVKKVIEQPKIKAIVKNIKNIPVNS